MTPVTLPSGAPATEVDTPAMVAVAGEAVPSHGLRMSNGPRNGPCKSHWLGYFVDREVGAIW